MKRFVRKKNRCGGYSNTSPHKVTLGALARAFVAQSMPLDASHPQYAGPTLGSWALWIGLSTVGMSLAWALLGAFAPVGLPFTFLFLPGFGSGAAQWLFFKPLPRAFLWIVATTLTSPFFSLALLAIVGRPYPSDLDLPLYARVVVSSLLAAPIATSQFLLLRRWFSRAAMWVPVATIGWIIAFVAIDVLVHSGPGGLFPRLPEASQLGLLGGVIGALQSTITGALLPGLRSRPTVVQGA